MKRKNSNILLRFLLFVCLIFVCCISCYSTQKTNFHTHEHSKNENYQLNINENGISKKVDTTSTAVYVGSINDISEGSNVSTIIYGQLLTCAAIEIEIHYDSELFSVRSLYNSINLDNSKGEFFSYNTSISGEVKVTYLFKENKDISGALFHFSLTSKQVEQNTSTYIDVAVGTCINENKEDIEVETLGTFLNIINKQTSNNKTASISASFNTNNLHSGDYFVYTLTNNYGTKYNAGEIQIEYDPHYLKLVTIEKQSVFDSSIVDINHNIKGVIFISFVSLNEILNGRDLFKVTFEVIADENANTIVTSSFSNFTNTNYDNIVIKKILTEITINKKPETIVIPKIYLSDVNSDDAYNKINTSLFVEANSNIGAADILISFDPNLLQFEDYSLLTQENVFVGLNKTRKDEGKLTLSILSTIGINDFLEVLTLTFSAKDIYSDIDTVISLSEIDIVTPDFSDVLLELKNAQITVKKHNHIFSEWNKDIEETCETDGSMSRSCLICDLTETKKISSLGHEPSDWIIIDEPTCTEPGSKYKKCNRCSKTLEIEEIPAYGHTYSDWIIDEEATCTTSGSKHKTCSCGDTITETIPALGHDEGTWTIIKDSTCIEEGTKHLICNDCGEVLDTRSIAKKSHDYETTVVDPTCTEDGYTLYTCKDCGHSYKDNYVSATGHTYSDWIIDEEPTYSEDGHKHRVCKDCGHIEEQDILKLDASEIFTETVNSIDFENDSLEDILEKIKQALEYYETIDNKDNVKDSYDKLNQIIERYQNLINEINQEFEVTKEVGNNLFVVVTELSVAISALLYFVLKGKRGF